MRLGIRAKQIAGVTAIVGLSVVAAERVLRDARRRASCCARATRAASCWRAPSSTARAQVVTGSVEPYAALRDDPGLRSILEASIYGESVTGASILDTRRRRRGQQRPDAGRQPASAARRPGAAAGGAASLAQLRVIYSRDGRTLEVRQPMMLGDEAFGSIRVGVSTLLMRQELNALAAAGAGHRAPAR